MPSNVLMLSISTTSELSISASVSGASGNSTVGISRTSPFGRVMVSGWSVSAANATGTIVAIRHIAISRDNNLFFISFSSLKIEYCVAACLHRHGNTNDASASPLLTYVTRINILTTKYAKCSDVCLHIIREYYHSSLYFSRRFQLCGTKNEAGKQKNFTALNSCALNTVCPLPKWKKTPVNSGGQVHKHRCRSQNVDCVMPKQSTPIGPAACGAPCRW